MHCLAAAAGQTELCEALLDAGAPINARNFQNRTALDNALDIANEDHREATVTLLTNRGSDLATAQNHEIDLQFERAADAIASGDFQTLKELLEETPALTQARSSRHHHATLLHYIGANGVEQERQKTPENAVEIAELLLLAGSDPNAPLLHLPWWSDETPAGLLVSSAHPMQAGLMLPLVNILARHGAHLSPAYKILNSLHDAGSHGAAGIEKNRYRTVRYLCRARPD